MYVCTIVSRNVQLPAILLVSSSHLVYLLTHICTYVYTYISTSMYKSNTLHILKLNSKYAWAIHTLAI